MQITCRGVGLRVKRILLHLQTKRKKAEKDQRKDKGVASFVIQSEKDWMSTSGAWSRAAEGVVEEDHEIWVSKRPTEEGAVS